MEKLKKIKKLFNGSALTALWAWSKPVRWQIAGVSAISVISSLMSLILTLVTKALVDAATGGKLSALWKYGALMAALYAAIWATAKVPICPLRRRLKNICPLRCNWPL